MKKVFIYYSLSGNGDYIAEYLKKKNYEIIKIETKKEFPKSFFLQILSGGFKASIKYKEKIKDFNININNYSKIIIGSPVWNSRISSPINTVLDSLELNNKELSFILYSGSGTAKHAINRINKEYPNSKIFILTQPKVNKDELNKLKNL